MIRLARTSDDYFRPRGGRWSWFRFRKLNRSHVDFERLKLDRALLDCGGPAIGPLVSWAALALLPLLIVWLFWENAI